MKISELNLNASARYKNLEQSPVAFFCVEYALDDDWSMYAGGLGVLAGDYLLEVANQGLPFVALGLRYGAHDDQTKQFSKHYELLETESGSVLVEVLLGQKNIKAQVWARRFGQSAILLLLDTDILENEDEEQQSITRQLYDSDFYTRLKQQAILGLGGVQLLQQLGFQPSVYHLNEGHTALVALGLMALSPADLTKVVATKHTIFSAAGSLITWADFQTLFGPYCEQHQLKAQAVFDQGRFEEAPDTFSTTKFLMTTAHRQNGVSLLHTVFEKEKHPNSRLQPITNGVYAPRWQAPEIANVSSILSGADLWLAKNKLRQALVDFIRETSGDILDSQVCTIVWARRFASYKRPLLLFSDLQVLEQLAQNTTQPVQIIISGKAHQADDQGQEIIKKIKAFTAQPVFKNKIVYLPGYSLSSAKFLVQGADLWLNTPEQGKEACGTSGMKAGLNGALQCSVSDGWVDEVTWQDKGWILAETKIEQKIYEVIENEILPLFYQRASDGLPHDWLQRMEATIELIEKNYLTDRMLEDYIKKLYQI